MKTNLKWLKEYIVQGDYGYGHGWEDVTAEETYKEAQQRLKEYRENSPGAHRLIVRRVPNPDYVESPLLQAVRVAVEMQVAPSLEYNRKGFMQRARRAFARNMAEPGDCRGDTTLLAALAVAEAEIGCGAGWIPEVQRVGCNIAARMTVPAARIG